MDRCAQSYKYRWKWNLGFLIHNLLIFLLVCGVDVVAGEEPRAVSEVGAASLAKGRGLSQSAQTDDEMPATSQHAYVSLIYDDSFLLGLRVLGLSLKETGTNNDMVAIAAGNLSPDSLDTLRKDGWRVKEVSTLSNPGRWSQSNRRGASFPARFWGVYTKLLVWNLTEYSQVVYLDADTIAIRNLDELFLCDGLCGVMRHSERLNSGVMSLQPNEKLLNDMLEKAPEAPSYTGGDQGFLNYYFSEFPDAVFFDPSKGKRLSETDTRSQKKEAIDRPIMGRLPTSYNADLGLYVANSNRWTVDNIAIIHYTLGSFKPWDWWSSWILSENGHLWQLIRARLPEAADGRTGGRTQYQLLASLFGIPLPWIIGSILIRYLCWKEGLGSTARHWLGFNTHSRTSSLDEISSIVTGSPRARNSRHSSRLSKIFFLISKRPAFNFPLGFSACAIAAGVVSTCLGLYLIVSNIPRQVVPWVGWILAYEWVVLFLLLSYGHYLKLCFRWGFVSQNVSLQNFGIRSPQTQPIPKELRETIFWCGSRPWAETCIAFLVLIFALCMAPWWSLVLKANSLVAQIVITAVSGAVSLMVAGQCFVGLAQVWFISGAMESNPRSLSPRSSVRF